MIILDNVTRNLQVVLSSNVTTNQLQIVSSYLDISASSFSASSVSTNTILTNNTTPVVAVSNPVSGVFRQLKYMSVYNADTIASIVFVQYNDNSVIMNLIKVTLQPGDSIVYNAENAWTYFGP